MKLSYGVARLLGRIAEIESLGIGVPMVISIVDENGSPVFYGCMDNALPVSRELAVSKAYTAAIMRMDTRTLGELSAPGALLFGIQNTHGGKIILFGGGMPLIYGDCVIGAVGISGGTVEEDESVALSVQMAFTEMQQSADSICRLVPQEQLSIDVLESIKDSIVAAVEDSGGEQVEKHFASIFKGAMILADVSNNDKQVY
jgi:uncharacterized protein GlcG (DUF336 family)